jgi:hypothetical protein
LPNSHPWRREPEEGASEGEEGRGEDEAEADIPRGRRADGLAEEDGRDEDGAGSRAPPDYRRTPIDDLWGDTAAACR